MVGRKVELSGPRDSEKEIQAASFFRRLKLGAMWGTKGPRIGETETGWAISWDGSGEQELF